MGGKEVKGNHFFFVKNYFVTDDTDRYPLQASVAQEVERLSTNGKIGGPIPDSSSPHVNVSLSKTLNPILLPLLRKWNMNVYECLVSDSDERAGTLRGSQCLQCMNMCE